jgi:2-phospho-L-lactate guanylyltransferase
MRDWNALWLLLPVKSLACGKSRLAPALGKAQRRALNEFFLDHTLAVAAQFPGLHRTAVVSSDPDALTEAARYGARTIACGQSGLNRALTLGRQEVLRGGGVKILILPIDLPLVEPNDLLEVASLVAHSVVICPDKAGIGTNAIFLSRRSEIKFKFGEDSCRRHQEETTRCGLVPKLHFNERIARDVDVPGDLAILREHRFAMHGNTPPV